jgi:hypothetical protein
MMVSLAHILSKSHVSLETKPELVKTASVSVECVYSFCGLLTGRSVPRVLQDKIQRIWCFAQNQASDKQ